MHSTRAATTQRITDRDSHEIRPVRVCCLRALSIFGAALVLLLSFGCASVPANGRREAEVRDVLEKQVREWNKGNLAGFMETYAKSDRTHFASGGSLQLGWQAVWDRYKARYGDAAGMGQTTFSDLEVTMLGPDAAMAFGRWRQKGARGEGSGLFTLILRRQAEGWRIVHDHTSVGDKN